MQQEEQVKKPTYKQAINKESWWPISKKIFLHEELGEACALFLALLVDKHDTLVENKSIKQGEWFYYLKEHITEECDKSTLWQDNARKKLEKKGIIETKLGQGKKIMYRISLEKFKRLL